jgi:hypothetical protein
MKTLAGSSNGGLELEKKRQSAANAINVDSCRRLATRDFEKLPGLLRLHGEHDRYIQAVGHLGELGAGSMLSLAMLDWKIEGSPLATRTDLQQAASVISLLGKPLLAGSVGMAGLPLVEAAASAFVRLHETDKMAATVHMRDGPFCLIAAAVLTNSVSKHLPLLNGLAPLIKEHNEDNYASLDALGLLAFITNDAGLRQAFEFRVERYLKAKWLLSFFRGTMIQIRALLARDQAALDAATEQTAAEFLQRAKDKKTLGQRQGLGMYSHVEFDLRGTTVGKLARLNGLKFEHDSRAIPLGVVTMFE